MNENQLIAATITLLVANIIIWSIPVIALRRANRKRMNRAMRSFLSHV